MARRNILRLLLAGMLIGGGSIVRAETILAIDDFCENYWLMEDCECDQTGDWAWTVECDFSPYEDYEARGVEFCNDWQWACTDTCDSNDYRAFRASEACLEFGQGVWCNPNCWLSDQGTNYSCEPSGKNMDGECGECWGFMWCEPQ